MRATTPGRTFFDTNILVYAVDDTAPAKQQRAQGLLDGTPAAHIVLSGQVLGEFYWNVTRKISIPLTAAEARAGVDWLANFLVVPIERSTVREAIALAESVGIAYWDALIVKAASTASCERVLTEDLNHSQVIDGVRIENPFLDL